MAVMNFLPATIFLLFSLYIRSQFPSKSEINEGYSAWSCLRRLDRFSANLSAEMKAFLIRGYKKQAAILDSQKIQASFVLKLLLLCGDIDLNPGPQWKYPCGVCNKPVRSNQKGLQCDYCDRWFHSRCCVNDYIYDSLVNSSCLWICCDCGLPSFSSSLFDSSSDIETLNRFSPLTDYLAQQPPTNDTCPTRSSTPTRQKPKTTSRIKRPLRLLNINCQSVVNKKEHLHAMIDTMKPDIIVGTESWLHLDIKDNEIFPTNFNVYRRDRNSTGGGVFTAVSNEFLSTRQSELETESEMTWVKLSVKGSKDLYICSYYRPDVSDEESLDHLNNSLDKICNTKNCHIWLAGDFNLPGFD